MPGGNRSQTCGSIHDRGSEKRRRTRNCWLCLFLYERASFQITCYLLLLCYSACGCYKTFVKGSYIGVFLTFVLGVIALQFLLDYLFSDRIIFYRDRVTKIWHALGSRTIYYSTAKIFRYTESLAYDWVIREKGPYGEYISMQLPIVYSRQLYHSDASEEIASILNDRTEEKTKDFWANKSESQCVIIFALFFAVLIGALLFGAWYCN
jgi:hypothetical protein